MSWYEQFLCRRSVTAEIKGFSSSVLLTRGTPQGGVLSPLVWNLNFDSLLELFDGSPVEALGFADDLSLLICGVNPRAMVDAMQAAINRAIDWGRRNSWLLGPKRLWWCCSH